jgi:CRISPR-associated protein Csy3
MAAKKSKQTPVEHPLETASVLAFERKLATSDALFFAGRWQERKASDNWPPIGIQTKSVRGANSNRQATDIEKPNLQTVDVATLPHQTDTLKAVFTLLVLAGTGQPSACNNEEYRQKLAKTIKEYVDTHKFTELARRYAVNLANGRFLWRNRIGAEQIEVQIDHVVDGKAENSWTFNALNDGFSLRSFAMPDAAKGELGDLSDLIAAGLRGDKHVLLRVTAYARMGEGQEVFPSQELILDRGRERGNKSKTLYKVNDVAAIHSQKIGNAIRTIDTWYPNVDAPIAVEVYGAVTTQGKAYRQPGEHDFYTLLDNWVLRDQAPPNPDDQHYVIAVLVRGGVFGQKEKEKN